MTWINAFSDIISVLIRSSRTIKMKTKVRKSLSSFEEVNKPI